MVGATKRRASVAASRKSPPVCACATKSPASSPPIWASSGPASSVKPVIWRRKPESTPRRPDWWRDCACGSEIFIPRLSSRLRWASHGAPGGRPSPPDGVTSVRFERRPTRKKTMKMFVLGAIAALIATVAAATGMIYSGSASVAADDPHHPLVFQTLVAARERAVERNARGITVPADLADPERIRRGAGNYDAMCAGCHLKPGEGDTEIRKGPYPAPPERTRARGEEEGEDDDPAVPHAAEHFWVIKHGIKASGMAAGGRGGISDDNIWDLVAFIQALPEMGAAEYQSWVAVSDGHSHGGAEEHYHHDDSSGVRAHDNVHAH